MGAPPRAARRVSGCRDADGGVAVGGRHQAACQAAHHVLARHAAGDVAIYHGPAGAFSEQAADIVPSGHIDPDQGHVADQSTNAHFTEQPHLVLGGTVDEQVGDGTAVADEEGPEGAAADGFPALAVIPVGVPVVGPAAAVSVEVEVGRQLVADAPGPAPQVHGGLGKGRKVGRPVGGDISR
ncbi:MAG: hypothetical protein OXU26_11115, partial [Acidobacteriota bacterium]|nr:hypothetical protein [Acidobacteriota bacterium]